jgi:hypothetical protein
MDSLISRFDQVLKKLDSNDSNELMKLNIYTNKYFLESTAKAIKFETGEIGKYYSSILCLKEIKNGGNDKSLQESFEAIKEFVSNEYSEVKEYQKNKLCVLQKDHSGACTCNSHTLLFNNNNNNSKIIKKITNIYNTPGNDDYIYKNRSSRLFPIVLSAEDEYSIRNKNKKLKCAIPLKEHATPFMLATAYLDFLIFIVNVKGVEVNECDYSLFLNKHKEYITTHFKKYNRLLFDSNGNTICPITHHVFEIKDIGDNNRDSRFNPSDTDAQLGHLISRSDSEFTTYGSNITLMSRRGNLLIGEHNFMDSVWIEELRKIVSYYSVE